MRYINGFPFTSNTRLIGLKTYRVPGTSTALRVRADIAPLLVGFARDFDRMVEDLHTGWCWSYAYRAVRGSSLPSFHGAGIAIDLNAPRHPLGRVGTFSRRQRTVINALCRKYGLRWGGNYSHRKDEMHFEVILNRSAALALVKRLQTKSPTPKPTSHDKYAYPGGAKGVRRGWRNSISVKRIQAVLGFPKSKQDGDFGPVTERAVKAWQKRHGLTVDGVVGPVTWGRMF